MKNIISFFALATILFCTSCAKEALLEPETNETFEETITPSEPTNDDSASDRSTILQITVSRVSVLETAGEYIVDLSSTEDLTEVELENTQYLDFTDTNGNDSTLTFSVNSYTGGNGTLQITFAIGGNNLTGLDLKQTQDIVIVDDLVN